MPPPNSVPISLSTHLGTLGKNAKASLGRMLHVLQYVAPGDFGPSDAF